MAYRQPHDPYGNPQRQAYNDPDLHPGHPPAQQQVSVGQVFPSHQQYQNQPQNYYQESESWETKSYQSTFAGSQVHLNPKHEMSEVHSAVPMMPYQQQPQQSYPPMRQASSQSSVGYSDTREKMLKRRSVVQVELQQGNLVLDLQVPSHIIPTSMNDREETTKMRYTAATCDPDDFMRYKYSLRPYLYGRETEIFIVMTMYNEDEVLFCRTMNAVIKNIAHLCSRTKSKKWGPNGWQKVVVCVVSDGRNKINKRTLQVLTLMGCYQEGVMKDSIAGRDVTAHIFEYTSHVVVSDNGEVAMGACPVQIIFCLKEQNKKKLNSHRWFFNAFGPLIKPNGMYNSYVPCSSSLTILQSVFYSMLVRSQLGHRSMSYGNASFDKHSGVGGACGEICVDTGKACSLLLTSPLAASQNFEYKMSNILDKPLESVFGYISVLPGAFSAYRYKALLNGPDGKGPLASYFRGETMHGGSSEAGLFERNMYLAEDRILCFEIVTKKREAWVLKYVKSAKAATDVPTTLEFIYNAIQLLFTWTSLANFYLAFFFLVSSATKSPDTDAFNFLARGAGQYVFEVFLKLYIGLIFIVTVCSLGNRPQGSKWIYSICILLFGLCAAITIWCAAWTVYLAVPHTAAGWANFGELVKTNTTLRDIVISLVATYGLYLIGSIMHLEPWHMFTSFIQYLFYQPSYINILMMYAMCNLHDVTWGTKGDNGAAKDLGGAKKVKDSNGKDVLEVEVPTQGEDVEKIWNAARSSLAYKPPAEKEHRDAATKQADHDRNSRTNVVLAWIGTNMAMILIFTSTAFTSWVQDHVEVTQDASFNPYLSFLFIAMAGLSAVRFVGSFLYLLLRLVGL
ncbi:hypothetical protein NM688_g5031 [Phlebia brevispora]|uniref:Uncharacterized protein n=1 Tax=Phlebia brevispora TaxID=194682 RepID=A0ACC1T196_9APHY|nr:hypothetical protein NM688_g5031 [Phlebia brevispora]